MSLPSQSGRASRSSSVHYRRSQGSPLRKLLPAAVVIAALSLTLWYVLRRPSDTSELQAANDLPATDSQVDNTHQPVVINNTSPQTAGQSPTRALPGSGDRPDTQREVENSLTSNTPAERPITSDPVTTTPPPSGSPSSSSLLDATRNQTTQQAIPSSTQTTIPAGTDRVRLQLDTAQRMVNQNDRVAARRLLSQTLSAPNLSARDSQRLRDELTQINNVLIFGPVVAPNDPICEEYKIQSGDSLSRIASRRELASHWKLIQRVNRISNPSRIRLGQNLKLVHGPFHAIVYKREHRMDIYHGSPNDPASWLFIKSLNVGLGADNGTPIGTFTVSTNKLENPGWVNPRNAAESYGPNDPANPIGEFWLGLDGVGQYATLTGYGIHGTIDPSSIGDDQSMGCVRLADEDIALVYELLAERVSVVEIRP